MDLLFTRLNFVLRFQSEQYAEQILERLKKTFREAFRDAACRHAGGCDCCGYTLECPYSLVFGQKLALDPDALKKHQKPPLPFVFDIRPDPVRLKNEDSFNLGLVLVGSAANHVREFCAAAITVLSFIPKISLARIDSVDCSGFANPILAADGSLLLGNLATTSSEDIYAISVLPPDHVKLHFLTPLRIIQEGRAIAEFCFSPFICSLLRRISSLAYYYAGSVMDLDYKRLSVLSKDMVVVESELFNSQTRGWIKEGLVGTCVVTGDLSDFHLLLLLGEYLHCGKGSAYGMGCYEMVRPAAGG